MIASTVSTSSGLLTHQLDGPPLRETVLLLNGGMMTIAAWTQIAQQLDEHFSVLRCDFQGQLLTPGFSPTRLIDHAQDVIALLDHLNLDRVHVFGVSFGAEVALELTATAPQRVRSLIAATASDATTDALQEGAARLRPVIQSILDGQGGHEIFHDLMVVDIHSEAYVQAHPRELSARRRGMTTFPDVWFEGLLGILDASTSFDLRLKLNTIPCPTLILSADDDKVMPPEHSRALARAIPNATWYNHPTSGHALIVEDPTWLVEKALDFLLRKS